jgi:hypothetical protein
MMQEIAHQRYLLSRYDEDDDVREAKYLIISAVEDTSKAQRWKVHRFSPRAYARHLSGVKTSQ